MVFSPYHESWRKHPMLTGANSLKFMFPGFSYAVAIFSTYCVAEFVYLKVFPPSHGHGHGHGHGEEEAAFDEPLHGGVLEPRAPKGAHH